MFSLKLLPRSHRCIFFDNTGEQVGGRIVKRKTKEFVYNGEAYLFLPEKATIFESQNLLREKNYYFYNLGNPNPIHFDLSIKPSLNSKDFNTFLYSTKMEELNDLDNKNSLWAFLSNPKFFIPLLIILALGYWYFSKGGKIT